VTVRCLYMRWDISPPLFSLHRYAGSWELETCGLWIMYMVVRVVCSWIIQTNFIGSVSARRNSSHGLVSCALASLRLRSRPFPSCLSSSLNELDLLKARGLLRADAYTLVIFCRYYWLNYLGTLLLNSLGITKFGNSANVFTLRAHTWHILPKDKAFVFTHSQFQLPWSESLLSWRKMWRSNMRPSQIPTICGGCDAPRKRRQTTCMCAGAQVELSSTLLTAKWNANKRQ